MSIQFDGSAEMGREATEIMMNLRRLPRLSFLLYDQRQEILQRLGLAVQRRRQR
jgi:hypothetical protein